MKNFETIIEEGLKMEPQFKLGLDFKDRVTKLIRKRERVSQRKFYMLIAFGIVAMFGAGFGVVLYFADLAAFADLGKIVPLAVLIGGLVAGIQFLDKKLVKDKMFKQLA
ncbi:MAG: hypothetical protein ABJG78_10520 [Cyclobacteriaceae bacterium]